MTFDWGQIDSGIVLQGEAATLSIGEWIGRSLSPNQTLAISGELGDGKTTLSKGIAAGWGVPGTVKSPTYNYFLTYPGSRGLLVHLDAYRLARPEQYDSLLMEDILEEPWLLLVEWPEHVYGHLPTPTTWLRIESCGENARRLVRVDPSRKILP